MAHATDEAQLDTRRGVGNGENLFVSFVVNDDIRKKWNSRRLQCITSERGIQHFNCDVLHARSVLCQMLGNRWIISWTNEYHGNAACLGGDDVLVVGWLNAKTHFREEFFR
jgi:hypothetical protein